MISRRTAALVFLSGGAWLSMGGARPRAQSSQPSWSPSYTITATLDPLTRRLDGRARIQWRAAASPITDLPQFILSLDTPGAAVIDGESVRATPVGAGVTDVSWTATIPQNAASVDLVLAAHWFPRLASGEAAVFDVTLTVPDGWRVAATGHATKPPAGTRTWHFMQPSAADFAFAAGRRWTERRDRVERREGGSVEVRLLSQPEHAAQIDRLAAGVQSALAVANDALAPYPYADLTVLVLPWRSPFSGQVFPAFVTVSTPWIEPARAGELETSLARGLARHFCQEVVGGDQVAHPWMVEGLSMYSASRLLEALVERQLDSTIPDGFLVARFFGGFVPYVVRSVRFNHALEGDAATVRAALALQTLERYLGWPTLEAIMADYGRQFSFARPAPGDFFRVAESVSGRDLRWFFDGAFDTANTFDYAVRHVTSERGGPGYRTTVAVGRNGDGVFSGSSRAPVNGYQSGRAIETAIEFGDGSVRREVWDGRSESTTIVYESVAPAQSVTVDPNRILRLDARYTNNTWSSAPRAAVAATLWSANWMTWFENVLLTYGIFV